jgi:hypothetical protein
MKPVLFRHPHIEIRQSPIHGHGIFAKEDILADTVLEEVPFIYVSYEVKPDYLFAYPRGGTPEEDMVGVKHGCALPFGYACLYNHGECANSSWKTDTKHSLFVFFTQKDVRKDEELLVYYGPDSYWSEHPSIKKI